MIKCECGKIIKFKTVTELLDVSVKTLQRWDAQGKIQVVRTLVVEDVFLKAKCIAY